MAHANATGLLEHRNQLLTSGRCGMCAERVPRSAIVRAAQCPECDSELGWMGGGDVLERLDERRSQWRLLGYGLVAAASFAAGAVPLLQMVVQLAAILILHVVVLRRGLRWLTPARRILARVAIKMWGAVLATMALVVNVMIVPFVGVSAFVLGFVGPLLTALYVEVGLGIVRRRLRWEADGEGLKVVEWGLPVAFLVTLFLAVAGTIAAAMGTLHLIANADIPTVSELARTFLEMSP